MKPYVYAVFLGLPCESIPPRQRFHLADKVITAREFNAHVRSQIRFQSHSSNDGRDGRQRQEKVGMVVSCRIGTDVLRWQ